MKTISISDELFQGAVSLERTEQGVKPWRIPYREFELFPPNGINGTAEQAAGVRLRFESDTTTVELRVAPSPNERTFDCVVNGELRETGHLRPEADTVTFRGLPPEAKMIDIYFSQTAPVTMAQLRVDESASFHIPRDKRPRWITYGSSITQCAAAASPAQTWPALVARDQGLHLTCLGYSGNCHMEPMVARMIRDLPADFISLCLGINVYGGNSYGPRTFRAAVIGFIQIVREKHKETPLLVISPIYSPLREENENAVGLNLVKMREEIEAAVRSLQKLGDANLYYLNGLELLGPEYASRLPDNLHPDAEGYRIMARRFQQLLMERVAAHHPLSGTR